MCSSPALFAAYRGLPRLRVPRHPPHALARLTTYACQAEHARSTTSDTILLYLVLIRCPRSLPTSVVKKLFPCGWRSAPRLGTRPPKREPRSRSQDDTRRATSELRTFRHRGEPRRLTHRSGKEVIQPQVPLRLPCYDFAPVTTLAFGRLARIAPVPARTSGARRFHGVTGGVYKARERIHRGVADPRLLAIPASRGRVAAHDPN